MATIERGIPLVKLVISRLKERLESTQAGGVVVGASTGALDSLESQLMVELPPTLRQFLMFDFTFQSFGKKWRGAHRFGRDPKHPRPKITSVRKLAEAITELGWTDSRIRTKLVRLPNLPGHPWNALYLGEARRDGELLILGIDHDETNVRVFPRYTAFDLYLADQTGLVDLTDSQRLDDLESHVALNPELGTHEDLDDSDTEY
jgi:hypothetical protein